MDVARVENRFAVTLDNRPLKTPGNKLHLPQNKRILAMLVDSENLRITHGKCTDLLDNLSISDDVPS